MLVTSLLGTWTKDKILVLILMINSLRNSYTDEIAPKYKTKAHWKHIFSDLCCVPERD